MAKSRAWTRHQAELRLVSVAVVSTGSSHSLALGELSSPAGVAAEQFRSAPTLERERRRASSSPTGRFLVARGLFEHGEAHRRASPRVLAFARSRADQPVISSTVGY